MTMMDGIETRINQIIADQLGLNDDEVSSDSTLSDDLGSDSLDLVELILALEEEFQMEIDDEDVKKFKTVKNIVDFISNKLQ